MKRKKFYPKKPQVRTSVRLPRSVIEVMRAAALREGISQSEFFRVAINERARRILLEGETSDQQKVA
jgi:hypothetical protein